MIDDECISHICENLNYLPRLELLNLYSIEIVFLLLFIIDNEIDVEGFKMLNSSLTCLKHLQAIGLSSNKCENRRICDEIRKNYKFCSVCL